MRAFFADGVDKMHIPWAVEGLPTLLHLSLFLFFGGLAIFLFNVDREVFTYVICWIGLFSVAYGLITVLPIIRHDSPYHSPLSTPAWFLYASILHVTFKILTFIIGRGFWSFETWRYYIDWKYRYQEWMVGGVEKAAEETALERSSKIDVRILDWTISALGDDSSLKSFFEAIPGFFHSKLVKDLEKDFPKELVYKFKRASSGFLRRTWTSNSIDDSEKVRRFDFFINSINQINKTVDLFSLDDVLSILRNDEVPQTVEMGYTVERWFTKNDQNIPIVAERTIARTLASVTVQERNDSWVTLAARVFGLPERDLWDNIALAGDNVLLAHVIHVARHLRSSFDSRIYYDSEVLPKLDICNTHSRLQHDFCTLWNEIVQEARNQGLYSDPVKILTRIRHLYIDLHQGTDAAPTAFDASTDDLTILWLPSSYPFCTLASHRPESTPLPLPTQPRNSPDALSPSPPDGADTASRQAEQANNVIEPPSSSNPTTTSATSHGPDITLLTNQVYSSSRPTSASLTAIVAAALQDITLTATLSHPLEGSEQQDPHIVASSAEPETSQILSTAPTQTPTPTLVPIPTSPPNTLSESYDSGVASVSNSSHFAPPSSRSSIPASRPTDSATFPRLRARGLVNTGNTYFANAVLQLLVNSPPFWNLFRELGNLEEQRGAGVPETGGSSTPLVDATVRFFKEFMVEEDSPSAQQLSQLAACGTSTVDEEKKVDNVVDSFEPTYLYDVMREKRQLTPLLVCSRALLLRPPVTDEYWPNVYRTANSRMRKSFSVYSLTSLTESCPCYSLLSVVASMPVLHLKQKNAWCLSLARLRWEVKASWCVNYLISALNSAFDKDCTDTNRPIWSSHLLRVYPGESSVRPSSRQTNPTLSLQKAGDHSISISRSVTPFSSAWVSCW